MFTLVNLANTLPCCAVVASVNVLCCLACSDISPLSESIQNSRSLNALIVFGTRVQLDELFMHLFIRFNWRFILFFCQTVQLYTHTPAGSSTSCVPGSGDDPVQTPMSDRIF